MSNVISIAERTGDCMSWEPRDLLLSMIRRIDDGEQFDGMLVAYVAHCPDKMIKTGMMRAKLHTLECVGLLEAAKYDVLECG